MNVNTIAIFMLGLAVIISAASQKWIVALLLFISLVAQLAIWYKDWRDR